MPNNESAPDNKAGAGANVNSGAGVGVGTPVTPNNSVGGGGGGKSVLGGVGEQTVSAKPLFVGFLFPSPLDEEGRLSDQPLSKGFGSPHLFAVVYGYKQETAGEGLDLHAEVDKNFGQPFFKAYIYPVKAGLKIPLINIGGAAGGKSVLGGASQEPIYLGQFRATLPDLGNMGNGAGPGNANAGNAANSPGASGDNPVKG